MAKQAQTLSDVREREWVNSIGSSVLGLCLIFGGALLIYFLKFAGLPPQGLLAARAILAIAVVAGGVILGLALINGLGANKTASVPCNCPYCGETTRLAAAPTSDYVCEHCDRTVHFQNGQPVAVAEVTCKTCRAVHKISITATYYLCDRCNRPMRLSTDGQGLAVVESREEAENLLVDYDVLLVNYDRRQEEELAYLVQNLTMMNLHDARLALESMSETMPLIVSPGVSKRKAEVVQRQLREKGGQVVVRPVGAAAGRR